MKEVIEKIEYGLYARKSSEQEDRQVLSIGSQVNEMTEIAKRSNLVFGEPYTEAHSAKAPGRPVFNRLFDDIEAGKIQGIIAWSPDRLSRNPMDAGRIIYLLDIGKLKEVVTSGQVFRNTPNDKFLLNLLCIQAKYDNDNKGVSVKRGLKAKTEMGIMPAPALTGYMNDKYAEKGNKTILPDLERFDLVRKMFDLMLTGSYNPVQVLRIANEDWGFRTKKGKKLAKSTFYRMLTLPFYYGIFEYPMRSGNWVKGIHKPMITEEEYDRIQILLGRKGRPRPKAHIFDFTGMMRCGECGAMITAEEKIKRQKNGNVHQYIYYHCTKKINRNCTQGSIEAKELKKQIVKEIEDLKIPPEFHEFALKWFRESNGKDAADRMTILSSQQKEYTRVVQRIDGLIDMRAAQEISAEQFSEKKIPLLKDKARLEGLLANTGRMVEKSLENADEMLTFVEDAKFKFETGGLEARKRILATLGSNLILKNRKLTIDMDNTLVPMKNTARAVATIHKKLEPLKKQMKQGDFERLYAKNPRVLGGRDSNPDKRLQRALSYH
jgi:site-specific DNA recombinase